MPVGVEHVPLKSQALKGRASFLTHHHESASLPLRHETQSAVRRVRRIKVGYLRTIRMKDFSFAAVRRFRGDGRDINNISVSIASCYGSDEKRARLRSRDFGALWNRGCASNVCLSVSLYRQASDINTNHSPPVIKEMWFNNGGRRNGH